MELKPLNVLARHLFGLAAIIFGVATFIWHDFSVWQQAKIFGNGYPLAALAYLAAAIQIFGGLAIQWSRTQRLGAALLAAIYFVFALLQVSLIAAQPRVYNSWNSFFEPFSQSAGALILFDVSGRGLSETSSRLARIAYLSFGISVVSFTLEQIFPIPAAKWFSLTASFVPKWIPPGQMFWAIATTVFFALAALALLSGICAILAARLLALMLISFQFLIWLPVLFAAPHKLFNWTENAENLSIAAAAWIVSDFLAQKRASSSERKRAAQSTSH